MHRNLIVIATSALLVLLTFGSSMPVFASSPQPLICTTCWKASISASPSSGLAPLTISITTDALGCCWNPPYNYAITFGDGTTNYQTTTSSNSITVSHTYSSAGTYTLSVAIGDSAYGGSGASTAVYVTHLCHTTYLQAVIFNHATGVPAAVYSGTFYSWRLPNGKDLINLTGGIAVGALVAVFITNIGSNSYDVITDYNYYVTGAGLLYGLNGLNTNIVSVDASGGTIAQILAGTNSFTPPSPPANVPIGLLAELGIGNFNNQNGNIMTC